MTPITISRLMFLPVMLCAVSVVPQGVQAQDEGANPPPPKVLFTTREFVKPGKQMAHEKSEAAAAAAMAAAKSPLTYMGLFAITGDPTVVSMAGYDSLAEVQSRYETTMKIPGLAAKLDQASEADSAIVSSENSAIWRLREDLSSTNRVNMAEMRFVQIVRVETRPGHGSDFEEVVKRVVPAWTKAKPSYHVAVYEMILGHHSGPVYLVIIPMKSMAEMDTMHDAQDEFKAALGADGMKSNKEAAQNGYLSSESNLFAISPEMSYEPSWVKADPTFWKPKAKAMMMAPKDTAKKPM